MATDPRTAGKKWEIDETTKHDSELKYQVSVPVDKREGLKITQHQSEKLGMKVIKKPVRVLLFAAAANRDYQFLRALLVREMEKKRLELAIHLQIPPGETAFRPGRVQDVPSERMLPYFPDSYGKKKDLFDLSSYDVIVCYDPDWNRLSPDQYAMIKRWAEKGGGLVMLGGYINTVELIRPREEDPDRFKPILDLLPVVLGDRREYTERQTDNPFALDFEGATPEMEFLKLDEEMDESKFKEDWRKFFYGAGLDRTDKPQRGFYNFYPVEKAKSGSIIVARYTDPSTRLKDNTLHPYMVISPESLPRSHLDRQRRTWRLREYSETYHERLLDQAGALRGGQEQGDGEQDHPPGDGQDLRAEPLCRDRGQDRRTRRQPPRSHGQAAHHAGDAARRVGQGDQAADPHDPPSGCPRRLVLRPIPGALPRRLQDDPAGAQAARPGL